MGCGKIEMMARLIPLMMAVLLLGSCYKSAGSEDNDSDAGGPDTHTGADADADTDSDADTDVDTDSDGDADSDGDSDTDADGDADSDSDTDTDTDIDSDTDTDIDTDVDSDSDTDTDTDTDTVTDPDILECLENYDWECECFGDCEDGFGYVVLYPQDAGDFPSGVHPQEELLEVGVGWYYCSQCSGCVEWHRIISEYGWREVTAFEFCEFIVQYDQECGDCLAESWGGGG